MAPLAATATNVGMTVALILAIGIIFVLVARKVIARIRRDERFQRGREGESVADVVLARRGFEPVDGQVTRRVTLIVDKEPIEYTVRADMLVAREAGVTSPR